MQWVLGLDEIDRSRLPQVGGKAANLGELTRLAGVDVPGGCCVTTAAYRELVVPVIGERLAHLPVDDHDALRAAGAEVAAAIATIEPPPAFTAALRAALERLGGGSFAVRSSATAEDLPGASFAGLHDSFLGVAGPDAVAQAVRRCWASTFAGPALAYRARRGFDHDAVQMAVLVQRMVHPRAAGVLFTADPLTGDRTCASVEAVAGLADVLVTGSVNGDAYTIRAGTVEVVRTAGTAPVLTDDEARRLVGIGRDIEAHLGHPQDIEWCLDADGFHVVQARPITTLFPVPATGDDGFHVYLSVGHQQMMTDPIRPLGLSIWQLTTARPMAEAGGRLFVDVTAALATPSGRAALLATVGRGDPLTGDALQTLLDRGLVPTRDDTPGGPPAPVPLLDADPSVAADLVAATRASIAAAADSLRGRTGTDLLDAMLADTAEARRVLFSPRSSQVITAGMQAAWWLQDNLPSWLGETGSADVLGQAVAHNITAEMGLDLLDLADLVRPHPDVVAFLEQVSSDAGDAFLDELPALPGGPAVRDGLRAYLERYGMRGPGEIDVTRPRWSEQPGALVPTLLGHVRAYGPGGALRRVEQGRRRAAAERDTVLARLRALPDGEARAAEAEAMIDRVRAFAGYREFPKYGLICRYALYRQALLGEADRLVAAGVLGHRDDVGFLRFAELQEVVRTQQADAALIAQRRADQVVFGALSPPRVLTSDGEMLSGRSRRDVPPGALAGLPVSVGVVEGRARVVADPARADLREGDVLVTTFTDPSWTPLFVTAAALVTEVGGLMTHGAVIAREYGLPAVVGVDGATRLIGDGARVRVDGARGFVELLDDESPDGTLGRR